MHTIPGSLLTQILNSVSINGIATPFAKSLESLQRFCRPLLFHKEHDVLDIAYSGSSLLFRVRGRNFVLCTQHQLKQDGGDLKPDNIVLVIEENGKKLTLTPNEATRIRVDIHCNKANEDILLVELHGERDGRDLNGCFLEIDFDKTATLSTVPPAQVVLIFAIGYPLRFADYEVKFDDDGEMSGLEVVSRWAKLYLQPRERNAWDLASHIPLKTHERYRAEIGDPNGFSGAPVLFVWQDAERQAHLGFAGMITHGNKDGHFSAYPAEYIRQVVNGIMAEDLPTAGQPRQA